MASHFTSTQVITTISFPEVSLLILIHIETLQFFVPPFSSHRVKLYMVLSPHMLTLASRNISNVHNLIIGPYLPSFSSLYFSPLIGLTKHPLNDGLQSYNDHGHTHILHNSNTTSNSHSSLNCFVHPLVIGVRYYILSLISKQHNTYLHNRFLPLCLCLIIPTSLVHSLTLHATMASTYLTKNVFSSDDHPLTQLELPEVVTLKTTLLRL